jgi:hypothetical protein
MAVVDRNSAGIANRDATPRVINNPALTAGLLRERIGYIAAAADDTSASVYRVTTVPSNARISEILLTAADFTTAGAINVGLHRTTVDGGAVVDADLFASAVDLSGGPYTNLDITREAGTTNWALANAENMLWQALGLTDDPCIDYDVTATISTTFNGGSGLLFKVRYVA